MNAVGKQRTLRLIDKASLDATGSSRPGSVGGIVNGGGSGAASHGSGTAGTVARWATASLLGNSTLTDDGATVTATGALAVTGLASFATQALFPGALSPTTGLRLGGDVDLYRSAANVLRTPDSLTVDLALTVTGAGSVGGLLGVGTTSPSTYLAGASGGAVYHATNPGLALANASRSYLQYISGTEWRLYDVTFGDTRLFLTAIGDFGIGVSPSAKLHVLKTTEQLRVGYDAANYWSAIVDSGGLMTLQGAAGTTGGDLVLAPRAGATAADHRRILPRSSYEVDLGYYNRKLRSLYAAELYVETLVAQDVMATIGGRIMVAPTTTLIADLSNVATTIDVKHNNLHTGSGGAAVGHYVMLEAAPAGVAQFEILKVANAVDPAAITGGYRYTVTRNVDASGANSWVAGDAAVSLGGAAGAGWIDLTSTSTRLGTHLGPTITIYSRTAATNWNDAKPTVSMGNLNGFVGYGSEMGFAVGNDLALTPTTGFKGATVDRTNGLSLYSTPLTLYNGSAATINFTTTGTAYWGTDVSAWATRLLSWTPVAVTTNFGDASETVPAGTLMIGRNLNTGGSEQANLIYDPTNGLRIRKGTSDLFKVSAAGVLTLQNVTGTGARIQMDASYLAGFSDATTKQFYIQSSDGKGYFGAGSAFLDTNGLQLQAGKRIRWTSTSDVTDFWDILTSFEGLYIQSTTAGSNRGFNVQANRTSPASQVAFSVFNAAAKGITGNIDAALLFTFNATGFYPGNQSTNYITGTSTGIGINIAAPLATFHANVASGDVDYRFTNGTGGVGSKILLRFGSSNDFYKNYGGYIGVVQGGGVDTYTLIFGTGSGGGVAVDRWQIATTGHLLPIADNTYDIGSASLRVNEGFFVVLGATGTRVTTSWHTTINVTNAVNVDSDARLKREIKPSPLGHDFLTALRPVSFKRRDDDSERTHYGFIAQDVQQALGHDRGLVVEHSDGMFGLGYTELIAPLVSGYQHHTSEINALKARIAALEKN